MREHRYVGRKMPSMDGHCSRAKGATTSVGVLNSINSPDDLKALPRKELALLAKEIRQRIVEVVATNGGHLAPSLGVVELTIALHRVFSLPQDKLVWDVGHQSYAHKLLTGRRDQFKTLRTFGGLSGFAKRSESPFDAFTTGHSSTSISAGLSIVSCKRLKKDRDKNDKKKTHNRKTPEQAN